ncbi:MAG: hypothetical protein K9H49_12425 [Bacteroidales bacterium]|nr:hypothetical protein [Bacteroidales bacterium]MCF8390602.1 hypothetical protein [Bacteroidales bacterium]
MKTVNKVINVSLTGGLIGALGSSPRERLGDEINIANKHGWHVKEILPASSGSLLYSLLRFIVLIITLFLYTFESGYYIILEKDIPDDAL